MKDLIVYIAQQLVDDRDAVSVTEIPPAGGDPEGETVFELTVAKADLGKVIGKQGRTARAIRTVLAAAAAKQHKRTVLEILE
jgi:predicted RNA-binding protein YlqC (UPF0109 family)